MGEVEDMNVRDVMDKIEEIKYRHGKIDFILCISITIIGLLFNLVLWFNLVRAILKILCKI